VAAAAASFFLLRRRMRKKPSRPRAMTAAPPATPPAIAPTLVLPPLLGLSREVEEEVAMIPSVTVCESVGPCLVEAESALVVEVLGSGFGVCTWNGCGPLVDADAQIRIDNEFSPA